MPSGGARGRTRRWHEAAVHQPLRRHPGARHGVPAVLPGARMGARGPPGADRRGVDFSHVRARQPAARATRSIDGIAYRWLRDAAPTPATASAGCCNIAAFLRARVARARRAWRASSRPTSVIASSTYPMDIWVARRIARLRRREAGVRGARPVAAVADRALGHVAARIRSSALCQKAEDDAYRDADVVVSMLPKVDEHMAAHGLDLRKLHIVPNGVAPDEWARRTGAAARRRCAAHSTRARAGRTVVGYAGSMGLPNALDVLLDAARAAARRAVRVRARRRRARARSAWRGASPPRG